MMYKVVETNYRYDLMEQVDRLIQDGWRCQGGVSMCKGATRDYYSQAMVKE